MWEKLQHIVFIQNTYVCEKPKGKQKNKSANSQLYFYIWKKSWADVVTLQ